MPNHASGEDAFVLHVIDGDTIIAKMGSKIEHIRLLGIDAPELHDTKTGVAQCYSREARTALKKLISKKIIDIQRDTATKNRDIYGRLLRTAKIRGVDASEYLVRHGFARVYTRSPSGNQKALISLQKKSKFDRTGLWKYCGVGK